GPGDAGGGVLLGGGPVRAARGRRERARGGVAPGSAQVALNRGSSADGRWRNKAMTFRAEHVSIAIERAPAAVYAFASDPEQLPRWAAGLSGSIELVDGEWMADSPMGRVKVRFADHNPFGILDHDVTLPSGVVVTNPMRVFANDRGSEVVFTVYQRPGMSSEELLEDARAVSRDLSALKALLEAGSADLQRW